MLYRGGDAGGGITFGDFGANDSCQGHVLEGLKVEWPTPGIQYDGE
jgi:hypothetical protein